MLASHTCQIWLRVMTKKTQTFFATDFFTILGRQEKLYDVFIESYQDNSKQFITIKTTSDPKQEDKEFEL